jgi:hypothetical protein
VENKGPAGQSLYVVYLYLFQRNAVSLCHLVLKELGKTKKTAYRQKPVKACENNEANTVNQNIEQKLVKAQRFLKDGPYVLF